MAIVKIYLKSGQTIELPEGEALLSDRSPSKKVLGFDPGPYRKISFIDMDQVAAVVTETDWPS